MRNKVLYYSIFITASLLTLLSSMVFANRAIVGFFIWDMPLRQSLGYLVLMVFSLWTFCEIIKVMEKK